MRPPPFHDEPVARLPPRWSDLRLRALSAAVLAPATLLLTWVGGLAFAGLVALAAAGLAHEWTGLCGYRRSLPATLLFSALPLAVLLTILDSAAHAAILLAGATAGAMVLGRGLSPARPLAFGIPWFGAGAVSLVWLRQAPASGGANVIVLLLVIWASDVGAYVAGRTMGGPRLAPSVSPGKTWSGAAGGLVASALVGYGASALLGNGPVSFRPAAFAALIGLGGQAGDLFESMVKRHFGVKDSGSLIPGHGGLLDRLDAVLTAVPAAALLALVLGRGVVLWQ